VKEAISTVNSPRPAGQYSQGLRADGLIFVAGQGPRNPASRLLPERIEARTHQVLRNIRGILHAGGSSMTDVVKESAHLADLADSDAFNAVYGKHFQGSRPGANHGRFAARRNPG
jgi:reactive intermediate/imine deaminase